MSAGFHAAFWLLGLVLGLLAIAVPVVSLAAVAWWIWTGPAARAGLRVRAWRFVRRMRS